MSDELNRLLQEVEELKNQLKSDVGSELNEAAGKVNLAKQKIRQLAKNEKEEAIIEAYISSVRYTQDACWKVTEVLAETLAILQKQIDLKK